MQAPHCIKIFSGGGGGGGGGGGLLIKKCKCEPAREGGRRIWGYDLLRCWEMYFKQTNEVFRYKCSVLKMQCFYSTRILNK